MIFDCKLRDNCNTPCGTAVNGTGYEIQQLTKDGWQTEVPGFNTECGAEVAMALLPISELERRVYETLTNY